MTGLLDLPFEDLRRLVGTRFELPEVGSAIELQEVEQLIGRSGTDTMSLEFTATGAPLPQATYRLEWSGGKDDLFIVPIASSGGISRYQAVINRLPA